MDSIQQEGQPPINQQPPTQINRKLLALFVGGGIVLLLFLILVILSIKGATTMTALPTPTPVKSPAASPIESNTDIQNSDTYKRSVEQIDKEQKNFLDQQSAVGQLLHKLPYTGSNFSMSYSFDTNQFTVVINKNNTQLGNTEFTNFLKANNIGDQNWIRNLVITYK